MHLQGSGSGTVPLVLDIGSNVGWLTFSAAKAGARVVAFEGEPVMCEKEQENAAGLAQFQCGNLSEVSQPATRA